MGDDLAATVERIATRPLYVVVLAPPAELPACVLSRVRRQLPNSGGSDRNLLVGGSNVIDEGVVVLATAGGRDLLADQLDNEVVVLGPVPAASPNDVRANLGTRPSAVLDNHNGIADLFES